jgi:hypothetical protein
MLRPSLSAENQQKTLPEAIDKQCRSSEGKVHGEADNDME